MKNLKKFDTHAEYETYIASDSAIKPNVSICANEQDEHHVHYNPVELPLGGFVDLDLPSGTLWARYNLGAQHDYECGDYYQWGALQHSNNRSCCWEYTPFNNGSSEYNEEYFMSVLNDIAPNELLKDDYDAVYQQTNGLACLPTAEQYTELTENTTQEGILNYKNSGMNVVKFTSNVDPSKYIIIPVSGYRYSWDINDPGDVFELGNWGNLWYKSCKPYSSVWDPSDDYEAIECLEIDYDGTMYSTGNYINRNQGLCLRGVINN